MYSIVGEVGAEIVEGVLRPVAVREDDLHAGRGAARLYVWRSIPVLYVFMARTGKTIHDEFTNPEHAREEDLAEGLVLSNACGARPQAARAKLEQLLGPATLVVESGSVWLNPETNESEPELYTHHRLRIPARSKEEHRKLE